MKKCFYLALLAIFLACLPQELWSQEGSPLIVDPPRFSKTAFFNWDLIEVIFTVRYLDGYEPIYDRMSPESMSFQPFELDPAIGTKLKIIRRQKYKEENYLDAVYYLRLVREKKGEVVMPAQKFFYVKLEPGKSREELEVKEFATKEVKLSYRNVLTSEPDDIIDRIDFGDFGRQSFWWKGAALAGFVFSTLTGWFLIFNYQPKRKVQKGSMAELKSSPPALAEKVLLTPKQARKKLIKVLADLESSGEEFENPRASSPKRRKLEADLCNIWREFLLGHVSALSQADTTGEMVRKIMNLQESFSADQYFSLANHLFIFERKLYEKQPFWNSRSRLNDELAYFRREIKNLNRPWIWWREFCYKFSNWRSK